MEKEGTGFAPEAVLDRSTTRMEILVFKRNPRKPGLISEYNRIKVFPDSGYGGLDIQEGEAYICILDKYAAGDVYYAKAIRKVDVNILMECDQKLKGEMIAALWKRNRAQFEPGFRELYLRETREKVEEELKAEHEARLKAVEDANAALKGEIRVLKNDLALRPEKSDIGLGSEEIVLSSSEEEEPGPPRAANPAPTVPADRPVRRDPMEPKGAAIEYDVIIQGNRLFCDALKNGRYYVHLSPDRRTLLIRPNEDGTIYAFNSGISIDRLGEIYGSPDPQEKNYLKAEYSEKYAGMVVHLRRSRGFLTRIIRSDVDFSDGLLNALIYSNAVEQTCSAGRRWTAS